MSCSPFDLRDYLLEELAEKERRQVESARADAARLPRGAGPAADDAVDAARLRDEEIPQRIGFVSDKVFEPSPRAPGVAGVLGIVAAAGIRFGGHAVGGAGGLYVLPPGGRPRLRSRSGLDTAKNRSPGGRSV